MVMSLQCLCEMDLHPSPGDAGVAGIGENMLGMEDMDVQSQSFLLENISRGSADVLQLRI